MPSARRSSSPSSSGSPNYPSASSSSSSTTTTTSDHSPLMSDEDDVVPPPPPSRARTPHTSSPSPQASNELLALPAPPSAARTPSFPIREDCWSEDATHTLVDAWGSHYLELNRGSLRQQHWQEVAAAVNALHAHTKKLHRTDIQCKNRIDTLKKKYKIEKYKSLQTHGRYVSTWPFFKSLDSLIGDNFVKAKPPSPSHPATRRSSVKNSVSPAPVPLLAKRELPVLPPPPSAVPVGRRSKRPAPMGHGEEATFRKNFSAMAAAAAAARVEEDDEEDSEMSSPGSGAGAGTGGMERRRKKTAVLGTLPAEGYRKLAEAIGGFAEIYERVEEAKQRQMVELEKQRMQFAKDLEIQRMKLFMESQVQLEKLKRSKRNSQSGEITLKGSLVFFLFRVI